jgi:hypothetical protein
MNNVSSWRIGKPKSIVAGHIFSRRPPPPEYWFPKRELDQTHQTKAQKTVKA